MRGSYFISKHNFNDAVAFVLGVTAVTTGLVSALSISIANDNQSSVGNILTYLQVALSSFFFV